MKIMKTNIKKNKSLLLALSFLTLILFSATFASLITTHDIAAQNIEQKLELPSMNHLMGTDLLGRDLFSRVIYGARMSLAVGFLSTLFSLTLGTFIGSLSGFKGGNIDIFLMRLTDLFTIFPSLLIAILLTLLLGNSFWGVLFSLTLASWVSHARLVRSLVLKEKTLPYVEAAYAIGQPSWLILIKHILPNCMGAMLVSLLFQIPQSIMSESFLSFVGLGLQPPLTSWGILANEGFRAMKSFPHLILFPGFILFLTLLSLQVLGEFFRKNKS